jgi:bacterioferritin-associated ferredoxin
MSDTSDKIICPCLGVTEAEVRGAVSTGLVQSLERVMECTGAGTGCTACRRRVAALLAKCSAECADECARQPASQVLSDSSSPTWVVR